MFNRLLALNSSFKACFPSMVRFSQWESNVYFCPLMNRRSFPDSRAYSCLRTLSMASPRCLRMWNLS